MSESKAQHSAHTAQRIDPRDAVRAALREADKYREHDTHCDYHHTEFCTCGLREARTALTDALDNWSAYYDIDQRKHAEMLEALRRIAGMESVDGAIGDDAIGIAKAAIRKATQEATKE